MNISLVIPLFNEEESLQELCALIEKVMQENNFSYEVILIDDGRFFLLSSSKLHFPPFGLPLSINISVYVLTIL